MPSALREVFHAREHRVGLLAADDRHRDDGRTRSKAELHEAAASESLQPVAIAKELPDALLALGEHRDERLALEEPLGVLLAGADGADAVGHVPEEREMKDPVFGEPAHAAVPRMLPAHGQAQHQAVERDGARVVGDEQAAALAGEALDAVRLDPEVPLVEQLEAAAGACARRPGRSRTRRPRRRRPRRPHERSLRSGGNPPRIGRRRGGSRMRRLRRAARGSGSPASSRSRARASIMRSSRSSISRIRASALASGGSTAGASGRRRVVGWRAAPASRSRLLRWRARRARVASLRLRFLGGGVVMRFSPTAA